MTEQENVSGAQPNSSVTTEEGGSSANFPPANCRPINVSSLVMGLPLPQHWFASNRRANRFYVVNLSTVMSEIDLQPTKSSSYFEEAAKIISEKTAWKQQYNFEYESSHTQIFPPSTKNKPTPQTAKLFGIAATIIVAMEVAANKLKPGYNVYDQLRILPAHFFVDRFNIERLEALETYFNDLSLDNRIARFGAASAGLSFETVCLDAIEQLNGRLLPQLAEGYCVTHHTANKLVEFIQKTFPSDLHVGPVRPCGENAAILGLGYKNAAPHFRAPKTIVRAELPHCY